MFSIPRNISACVLVWLAAPFFLRSERIDATLLRHIANISSAADEKLSAVASIFSPRMDFDQWKPLTGRGDPLRNDPTYDYEPPVLERVHYWAEDTRLEREHFPERKSEVLMLGVSSRRPSVTARLPSRGHPRPPPMKYEDFSYKINHHYPMTILVPPPPPPPGHKPALYILQETKKPLSIPNTSNKPAEQLNFQTKTTTPIMDHLTSLYALQESNLIYQSSTTNQNWINEQNKTKPVQNSVSSDYAGWGPTTPLFDIDVVNDTHNLIPNDHFDLSKHTYTFYKPMLSEAPPPPPTTTGTIFRPSFLPTVLPPTAKPPSTESFSTHQELETTTESDATTTSYYELTSTEKQMSYNNKPILTVNTHPGQTMLDMLRPMMSMPLINGPERPEDNLYAHASENLHAYKESPTEDSKTLETMQTMQPPPPEKDIETTTEPEYYVPRPHGHKNLFYKKPSKFTRDPYVNMRFTTATPTDDGDDNFKTTSELPPVPMYLIIQGHSKVKTYSSKPTFNDDRDTISNEIPKPDETAEVKHLHPIREKKIDKANYIRESRSKSLKSLVDENFGSIEIQEADIGIKYDVSDGSNVPVEIYRRGIVENDENDYSSTKRKKTDKRSKRQIDLEDLLPFDEDTIEEYVFNYINDKRNSTGITGLIAQAITSDAASVVDELEEDDENNEHEEDER